MSRRKTDKTKELADRTPFEHAEVRQYGDVAVALSKTTEQLASDVADAMDPDYDEVKQALADVHAGRTHPVMVEGLTDDPCGRVAEAVYAQVFAATWVKRQDLSPERRRTTASVEASLAMDAARGAYVVELGGKPEDQA